MRKAVQTTTQSSPVPDKVTEAGPADAGSGREMMQAVLAKPRKPVTAESAENHRINGIVIGTLAEPAEDGRPMVYYPGMPTDQPLAAVSTTSIDDHKAGHEVALGFVGGDPALPIILGLIQKAVHRGTSGSLQDSESQVVDVKLDGDRLTLSADREIVLQCGESSITLTRAGKVILKGAYVSTHATGVNRIKGGSVQIN